MHCILKAVDSEHQGVCGSILSRLLQGEIAASLAVMSGGDLLNKGFVTLLQCSGCATAVLGMTVLLTHEVATSPSVKAHSVHLLPRSWSSSGWQLREQLELLTAGAARHIGRWSGQG